MIMLEGKLTNAMYLSRNTIVHKSCPRTRPSRMLFNRPIYSPASCTIILRVVRKNFCNYLNILPSRKLGAGPNNLGTLLTVGRAYLS